MGATRPLPLLLLDVDGVLFPFRNPSPPPGYRSIQSAEHSVWLKPAHGVALQALTSLFELVWATTWEHKANKFIGPALGLLALPVIEIVVSQSTDTRKLPSVSAYVGDRPFVWVDDELFTDAYKWAEPLPQPTLLVRSLPSLGLTDEQLQEVEAFGRYLAEVT